MDLLSIHFTLPLSASDSTGRRSETWPFSEPGESVVIHSGSITLKPLLVCRYLILDRLSGAGC